MKDIMRNFILPGLSLLPEQMDSPEARAMLFAIGMQESRFKHRRQIGGPARGFWQFERGGGIQGVFRHRSTSDVIASICCDLVIEPSVDECYEAVTYNDQLAVCFARLLLWPLREKLPTKAQGEKGWQQYLAAWRPGKPHSETWSTYFDAAWIVVNAQEGGMIC